MPTLTRQPEDEFLTRQLADELKTRFPGKRISVRFVPRMPRQNGSQIFGDATHYDDGRWVIRIRKTLTVDEQINTIIHEFAHVARGIPRNREPHDALFFEHLGRITHWAHEFLHL